MKSWSAGWRAVLIARSSVSDRNWTVVVSGLSLPVPSITSPVISEAIKYKVQISPVPGTCCAVSFLHRRLFLANMTLKSTCGESPPRLWVARSQGTRVHVLRSVGGPWPIVSLESSSWREDGPQCRPLPRRQPSLVPELT